MSEARPQPRVLIVDDNEINAELARAHLSRAGWATQVAAGGAEGLAAAQAHRYELILLDISMPGISGIDVCRSLRAMPADRPARIVAYTAHALPEERCTLIEAGFDEVLTKPVDRRAVREILERLGFDPAASATGARS